MARQDPILVAFNRGEISTQLLGRTDLEHLRLAAQIQENWEPRVLGPMTLRPGSEMIGQPYQNKLTKLYPFIAQADDTADLEFTDLLMRVWVDDALVTRAAVSTKIPPFGAVGWYASVQTGTAAVAVDAAGLAIWDLNIGAAAAVDCLVTVAGADIGKEHAVRLVVLDGPIIFRVGSAPGLDDYFLSATLDTGTYSMAFTPFGNFYVEFHSSIAPENYSTVSNSQPQGYQTVRVASIVIEAAGPMTLPTPWPQSQIVAPTTLKFAPSGDVIFVAALGLPQYEIIRYTVTSWSIVLYKPVKGPMNAVPGDKSVVLSIGTQVANTSLTSNQPTFSPSDVGTLFRLFHWQQYITSWISFPGTWTDSIRVTGVSVVTTYSGGTITDTSAPDRNFNVNIQGTWSGTVTLQRSFETSTTGFVDYKSYTGNVADDPIDDQLNNEIIYYRLGAYAGAITGTPICSLAYSGGGAAGVCHVTGYVSATELLVEVLVPFTASGPAYDWRQSEWSAAQGYPTAVGIHEGRLWWAGADRWWGSTSDDYTNFDFDEIGDAAYIDITVGQGPIANINWLTSIDSLLGGGDTQVIVARSDAIQTPLTPTNFNLRFSTTQGTSPVQSVKIDNKLIFINQSSRRIYVAVYDLYTYNYKAVELSNLNPDIGGFSTGGFTAMAVQRNPDTIVNLIRADGQIVCLLYDTDDDVKAFWRKTTPGGLYEDIIVKPGVIEDEVKVVVNRAGNRYIEKFARLDECFGDMVCKLVDSFAVYQGVATNKISAPWLANQAVAVWADGTDAGLLAWLDANPTKTISDAPKICTIQLDASGNGTLSSSFLNITFGLPYTSKYLSTKLAYGAQHGTAINEVKKVDHIGFVMQNTHAQGVRYGAYNLNPKRGSGSFGADFSDDFDTALNAQWDNGAPLDDLPLIENGAPVDPDFIWAYYDNVRMEWSGNATTDARLYIEAASPRPATVVAVTFSMESNG